MQIFEFKLWSGNFLTYESIFELKKWVEIGPQSDWTSECQCISVHKALEYVFSEYVLFGFLQPEANGICLNTANTYLWLDRFSNICRGKNVRVMTGHYMNQRLLSKGSHFTTPGKNPWLKVAENTGCQVRQNMNTVIFIRTFCVSCDFLLKHIAGEQTRVMWRTNKTKCKFVHTRHQHRHYVYMGSMTKHVSRFAHNLRRLRDTFSLPANLDGESSFRTDSIYDASDRESSHFSFWEKAMQFAKTVEWAMRSRWQMVSWHGCDHFASSNTGQNFGINSRTDCREISTSWFLGAHIDE